MTSVSRSNLIVLRKLLLVLAVAGFSAAGLAGCNTIEGAGQDIENAGEEIEESAD